MKTVFVDTSGFYALLDGNDPFYPTAKQCFLRAQRESWALVTTNYVVPESWSVIQSRLGWDAVDAWADRVLKHCEIIWVTEEIHSLGEARCRHLSLTDCVSIEVMRLRGISEAIAQDEHFSRAGIRIP
jgi:predicted nucleic acid-binding protein